MPESSATSRDEFASSPVVMAGVGGSGTRVVAEIVEGLDVFIGESLNSARDNLWWTTLFSRPEWFYGLEGPEDPAYQRTARLFEDALRGDALPTPRNLREVFRAYRQGPVYLLPSLRRFGTSGWDRERHRAWGFKEPNALLYLRYHRATWPGMRYVHVIRNGLDMAWSGHPPMYEHWRDHYGIDPPVPEGRERAARLKWWVRANQDALDFCRNEVPDRHLVVRFEELCREPRREVERIADFLGADADEATLAELAQVPRVPDSLGRHRDHDLSLLDAEDLDAVEELGYDVDHARDAQR